MDTRFEIVPKRSGAKEEASASRSSSLNGDERAQLSRWNQTAAEFPAGSCMHHLLETAAMRAPDAVAVIFKDQSLTYRQLHARADRLAQQLRSCGIGPEQLVGLCVDRSQETAVGVLAVLKAGGAYVPLDPNYPDERLKSILSDAHPGVILTHERLLSQFAEYSGRIICLDDEKSYAVARRGDDPAPIRGSADDTAYVIFTSGSTGRPKGVLISHRSLVNHSTAMARYYDLRTSDRVLQFASLSFDVAAEEIFPTWLSGATLVIWPVASGVAPVRNFLEFVEDQQITVLNLPAPYWHEWTQELDRRRLPPSVRLVVVGSDKVSADRFSVWKAKIGNRVRFCNAYGPTEATITATVYEANESAETSSGDCLPIGRPIANTQIYLLDDSLRLLPPGAAGELHIGGAGLARGYLKRPQLTAEKFIRNPFGEKNGDRLYKTGDVARYRADGNLEFLGRVDDQVKIRGYRIETGEIEAVLRRFPGVREAVVTGCEADSGEKQLVGYVVIDTSRRPPVESLKDFLKDRLPEYMVPAAFVMLARLPLTASGKVDRRELPAPPRIRIERPDDFVAPRTEMEIKLAGIWESMLGVRPIGITEDFFDLGGHSLQEIRLVAEVEKKLGVTLPLLTLYRTRTIESLARILHHIKYSSRPNSLIQPYRTEGDKPPIFSHGGSNHFARYLGEDQPIYWLELHGMSGLAMPGTIEAMAADYVQELALVQPEGPYFLVGYSMGGLVIFEVAQQLVRQGKTVGLLVLIDPCTPHPMLATPTGSGGNPPADHSATSNSYRRFLRKFDHLGIRIPRRIRWAKRAAQRISRRAVCEACLRLGHRLPPVYRDFYFAEKADELIQRYVPQVYPGSFILFRRPDNGTEPQWRELAKGHVEIYNTWVDHNYFMEEPYVQTLASKIKDHLRVAQAAAKTSSRPESIAPADHSRGKRPGG